MTSYFQQNNVSHLLLLTIVTTDSTHINSVYKERKTESKMTYRNVLKCKLWF